LKRLTIDEGFLRILGVDPDILADTLGEDRMHALSREVLGSHFETLTSPLGEGHDVRVRIQDGALPRSWAVEFDGAPEAVDAMLGSLLANIGLHECLLVQGP